MLPIHRHWSAVAENLTKMLSDSATAAAADDADGADGADGADFDLDKVTEPLRSFYKHGNHDALERTPAFSFYNNAASGQVSHVCCEAGEPTGPLWCARTLFVLNDGDTNAGGFADVYDLLVEVGNAAVNSYVTYSGDGDGDGGGGGGEGGSATYLNASACATAAEESFWSKAGSRGVALAAAGAAAAAAAGD